jgi:hypothetical protein
MIGEPLKEETQKLNPETEEPGVSEDVLKERAAKIDEIYHQRVVDFETVVEKVFPHEDNKPGDFDKILAEAKKKITEKGGDPQTHVLSESEKMALVLEDNRNWAEQQRAQELRDLQEIKSHSTKK